MRAHLVAIVSSLVITLIFIIFILVVSSSQKQDYLTQIDTGSAQSIVSAFPGAEGFGSQSPGGRGGKVLLVTSLADSGPGTLRNALENTPGPRIVVFRIGGTIALTKPLILEGESDSYVTIAGQTAPGGGIQLKNYGISLHNGVHDVVMRYLKIRPGQNSDASKGVDGIEMYGYSAPVYNIVIDHISAQWAMDENISLWNQGNNITIQNSIIAEASTQGQNGEQAKGLLMGSDTVARLPENISIHHNLFAHNPDRNPRIAFAALDFRNNIIYNWGNNNSTMFGNYENRATSRQTNVNVINNIWKKGQNSKASYNETIWVSKGARLFVQGNWGAMCPTGCPSNEWGVGIKVESDPYPLAPESVYRVSQPFVYPAVRTDESSALPGLLTSHVGASIPARDSVDSRIVGEYVSGTGSLGIKDSHPTLITGTAPTDIDGDGMPDNWEVQYGFNPKDPHDAAIIDQSGYSNIEVYINSLSGGPVPTVRPAPTTATNVPSARPSNVPANSITPSSTALPSSPTSQSRVMIYAKGVSNDSTYPAIELLIDGIRVRTFTNISYYRALSYTHPTYTTRKNIRIRFINDNGPRDIRIDKIAVNGITTQAENSSVFFKDQSGYCPSGYLRDEWMYCNGYIQF